ncbi:hypothetical protein [Rosistilla oblonga]|uniref:hypothetical protein n=1 Tax=Rosistilla oblonga TaxID=2527990 RepID=UPI003A9770C0
MEAKLLKLASIPLGEPPMLKHIEEFWRAEARIAKSLAMPKLDFPMSKLADAIGNINVKMAKLASISLPEVPLLKRIEEIERVEARIAKSLTFLNFDFPMAKLASAIENTNAKIAKLASVSLPEVPLLKRIEEIGRVEARIAEALAIPKLDFPMSKFAEIASETVAKTISISQTESVVLKRIEAMEQAQVEIAASLGSFSYFEQRLAKLDEFAASIRESSPNALCPAGDLSTSDQELLQELAITNLQESVEAAPLARVLNIAILVAGNVANNPTNLAWKRIFSYLHSYIIVVLVSVVVTQGATKLLTDHQNFSTAKSAIESIPRSELKRHGVTGSFVLTYRDCDVASMRGGMVKTQSIKAGTPVVVVNRNGRSCEIKWTKDGSVQRGWTDVGNIRFIKQSNK